MELFLINGAGLRWGDPSRTYPNAIPNQVGLELGLVVYFLDLFLLSDLGFHSI